MAQAAAATPPAQPHSGANRRPAADAGRKHAPPADALSDMEQSRTITRKSASNLALAFVLLPREEQDRMSALYAFCREVDDVADEESVPVAKRREQLAAWRDDIRRACTGETPHFPVN